MLNSEHDIFLNETEVRPNRYATLVLFFLLGGQLFCFGLTEFGLFQVGKTEMRIATLISTVFITSLLLLLGLRRSLFRWQGTKWMVYTVSTVFTMTINTLLSFHTTMMLLFPIFVAMLYRSKAFGVASIISSGVATAATPILGYVFHFWDIPLFKGLITIATGATVEIVGGSTAILPKSILDIVLYLVLPRMIMVGSCGFLMFYVIRLGVDHVQTQILLDRANHCDALTGLYNRACFKQLLDTEKSGAVGLIFFDVNELKVANDTYGHEYGDMLLLRSAKSLTDVCDEHTAAFRLGGDEFLLVMEHADRAALDRKVEEWKSALEKINKENMTEYEGLVCSMAHGCALGDFSKFEELLRCADVEMYETKAWMKGSQPD